MKQNLNVAVFASGNGSNAENIIRSFRQHPEWGMNVAVVLSNKADAYVLNRAESLGVSHQFVPAKDFRNKDVIFPLLDRFGVDAIVLAGFLLMVPDFIIERYGDRILNIHPSLLPKFGGKGMYGHHVHEAVVAAGEKETGITVHRVTDRCDEGAIVFQARFDVTPEDTPETVEAKIHELEQAHYPRVIAETFARK